MVKFNFSVVFILLLTFSAIGQQMPDYSGVWTYEKIVSQPSEPLRAVIFRMAIEQNTAGISVSTSEMGNSAAPSPPPISAAVSFNFEKKTISDFSTSKGMTSVTTAVEVRNKKMLVIVTEQIVPDNRGKSIPVKIRETFELAADKSSLLIHRQVFYAQTFPILESYIAHKQSTQSPPGSGVRDAADLKAQFPKGIINESAKHLEKPRFDSSAQASRISGSIPIKVIFDETGRVIFAQSVNGQVGVKTAAVEAAMKSTFEPVTINGQPVRISGDIIYDFDFQQRMPRSFNPR